jgi:hypothetical protein
VTDQCLIPNLNFIDGGYMFTRNDEDMDGRGWIDIQECDHLVILVNSRTGAFIFYDTAKNAI